MASADELRRRREDESAFAFLYDMARERDAQLAAEGRRPFLGGLLSVGNFGAGADKMDVLRDIDFEGVGSGLLGLLSPVARAIDAPISAYRGTIPQEDMLNEAMNVTGMAMAGGGAIASPQGALASNALRSAKPNDFPDNEMTLYHGSPYDFREFNLDHIGKGEGQQDLGRGFSLTDDENVARLYMNPGSRWGDLEAMRRYEEAGPGRRYEVAVKARPDQFLDFKKPWKDQVPEGTPLYDKIQERMARSYADDPEMQELFQQANLSRVWRDRFGMEDAAMQSGFVGNKLQGFSGQTQFTVFDPAEMKIKKVFDDEGRQMPIAPPNDGIVSANASRSAGLLASGFDNKDFVEPGKQFMRPMPDPDNDRFAPSDTVMAQRILDMRADGRASEVTDEMMTQADPAFMFNNTPLAMDAAARMERARAAGFDADGYHGTVVDHASLKPSVMGKHGPGVYTADGPEFAGDFAGKMYGKDEYLDGGKVLPMSIRSNPAPDEYRANAEALKRSAANPFDGAGEFTGYLDDNGFTGVKVGSEQTTVNPANMRSRFARFDPEFAHLRNLSSANASTVGGLLAQSGVSDKQAEKIETYLKKVGLLQ